MSASTFQKIEEQHTGLGGGVQLLSLWRALMYCDVDFDIHRRGVEDAVEALQFLISI
jgi:hypothetical protein